MLEILKINGTVKKEYKESHAIVYYFKIRNMDVKTLLNFLAYK